MEPYERERAEQAGWSPELEEMMGEEEWSDVLDELGERYAHYAATGTLPSGPSRFDTREEERMD